MSLAIAGQVIMGSISSFGPAQTLAGYGANALLPVELPDANEYLSCYLNGWTNYHSLRYVLRSRGIDLPLGNTHLLIYAIGTGSGQADLNQQFVNLPTNEWGAVMRNRTYLPSIDEAGFLQRRKLITNDLYRFMVGRQVDGNVPLINAWQDANFEIPGSSDLVRFAVREAFNPNLIELFGYHKEMPLQIIPWMEKQGYGGTTGISIPPGGTDGDDNPRGGAASWADLYWWSHWELPSLTQGYEMLHRLYPSSDYGASPDLVGGDFFDGPALELLQKAQDIPLYWRRKLQAISYHPYNRTDAEYMFENSLMTEAELYHAFRGEGYDDTKAKKLILMAKRKQGMSLTVNPGKLSVHEIIEYYKNGVVTDTDLRNAVGSLGYTRAEADAIVVKADLELKADNVTFTTKMLEQAYYRGLYNQQSIRIEMTNHGLNTTVIDYLLVRWDYKRQISYKSASAKQNLTYFKNGVLSEANLQSRLFNLGYDGASITSMINNAKMELLTLQQKALLRQAKQQAQQAKQSAQQQAKLAKQQLAQQQKQAQIVTNKANKRLRAFLKAGSDANIKAWWKDKTIQLWEIYYRLYHKGFNLGDAERWVEHNMSDSTQGDRNVASKKAQTQYRNEGNPPIDETYDV